MDSRPVLSWLRTFLWAAVGALVLVAAVACSPIRWDAKALRNVWIDASPPLGTNRNLFIISRDNGWRAAHVAAFGAELVTFPRGRSAWIVLAEGYSPDGWPPALVLHPDGRFIAPLTRAETDPPPLTADDAVMVTDAELSPLVSRRWSAVDPARLHVQTDRAHSILQTATWRMSTTQALRIGLGFMLFAGAGLIAWRLCETHLVWCRILCVALSFPLLLMIHGSVAWLLGFVTDQALAWALVIESIAVWAALGGLRPAATLQSSRVSKEHVAGVRAAFIVLLTTLVILGLGRRDFDGDVLSHWLPAARADYLAGRHDVRALDDRFGLSQESTYPPAFPLSIASLLWMSDSDATQSAQPGTDTNIFVLLYRLVLALLSCSVIIGAAALAWGVRRDGGIALGVALLLLAALPLFGGSPLAGEAFLVPIVGAAIVAWIAADFHESAGLAWVAVFLAFSTLMIKNDAKLILPLVLLPWGVLGRARWIKGVALAALLALVPWVLWQWSVRQLNGGAHFAAEPISLHGIVEKQDLILRHYVEGARLLLESPAWIVLLVLLPALLVSRLAWGNRLSLAIPACAAAFVGALPLICAFIVSDQAQVMSNNFIRIASSGVLSIVFYAVWLGLRPRPERDALDAERDVLPRSLARAATENGHPK